MRQIKIGSVFLSESDKRLVRRVLNSNQITPGPYVDEFQETFSKMHGAKHGLFVNSGTDALRIALATLKEVHGWSDGDLVIVPAVTFVATVNVILQCKLTPYFVDVSMMSFNLNPEAVAHHLKCGSPDRLRAIIPVHLFGQPCDMDNVLKVAHRYKLKVLEDSCETMGVSKIRGDIACYSTYACHLISTGVGGLAITNNPRYANVMWSYANHGRRDPGVFKFDRIGYSSRATEIQAALGLAELKRLPQYLKRRRQIADRFNTELSEFWDDLVLPHVLDSDPHAFMMYPIVLKETSKRTKKGICRYLAKCGIETRDMMPITNQPCYKHLKIEHHSVANWINKNGFYIGCHPGMTEKDVAYVIARFRTYLTK